ncbi:MAG: hypothetical protein ACXVZQ_13315, partial [Terriglobales bacterium]
HPESGLHFGFSASAASPACIASPTRERWVGSQNQPMDYATSGLHLAFNASAAMNTKTSSRVARHNV